MILVTGATGNVGRHVVAELVAAGAPVRAASTRPERAVPGLDGAERVRFAFQERATWDAAFAGVDRLFLLRPPAITDTKALIRPVVRLAARRGVRSVVFLSLLGVNPAMPHYRIERDIVAAGLPRTFLRAGFFAQNLDTAYRADIRDHDRIRLPAGRGRTSFVDTRDLAAVAARALLDPAAHRDRAWDLTGPRALGYGEVAALLSAALGRPIVYQPIGLPRYWRELRAAGLPRDYRTVQMVINVVARLGLAAKVTDDLPRLLGRPPIPLEQYVQDYREEWERP